MDQWQMADIAMVFGALLSSASGATRPNRVDRFTLGNDPMRFGTPSAAGWAAMRRGM